MINYCIHLYSCITILITPYTQAYIYIYHSVWSYSFDYICRELQVCPQLVHTEFNTMVSPRWWDREQIYRLGWKLDLSANYAVHLFYRSHSKDYDPIAIRSLDSPLGSIFRGVYYGNETLLERITSASSSAAGTTTTLNIVGTLLSTLPSYVTHSPLHGTAAGNCSKLST